MLRTLVAVFFWIAALFLFILSLTAEVSAENQKSIRLAEKSQRAVSGKPHGIPFHPAR